MIEWFQLEVQLALASIENCLLIQEFSHCLPREPERQLALFLCAALALLNQWLTFPYFIRLLRTGDFEETKFSSRLVSLLVLLSVLTIQLGHTTAFVFFTAIFFILDILMWLARSLLRSSGKN
jgi:hypothetical protein